MIQFTLNYTDKCNIQGLEITVVNEYKFNNEIYIINEADAKEIYLFLNSDNIKEIQEYLSELIQDDDVPNLSQLSQRGEI